MFIQLGIFFLFYVNKQSFSKKPNIYNKNSKQRLPQNKNTKNHIIKNG
jgi:hypothetical protein